MMKNMKNKCLKHFLIIQKVKRTLNNTKMNSIQQRQKVSFQNKN